LMTVIAIISVGMVAAMAMIDRTKAEVNIVRERFAATYLGQEGIEIVRNIRDANWMEDGACWLDGLHLEGEEYGTTLISKASYDELDSLEELYIGTGDDIEDYYDDTRLYIDNDDRYHHDGGGEFGGFSRVIEVSLERDEDKDEDYLEVDVYVQWSGGEVHISKVLYNWLSIRSDCNDG